jgi:hypothetical protein
MVIAYSKRFSAAASLLNSIFKRRKFKAPINKFNHKIHYFLKIVPYYKIFC